MAITYHAGRRIQGTQADFDGTLAVSGGWKEVGRTTLQSAPSGSPTYNDDFTSDNSVDQDASKISVNTAQERWDFNIVNDQTNDSSSIDIGSALSDSKWVMDFDYTWTSLSGTTNVNTSFFGISNSNGTVPSQTAQDHIGVRFQTGAGFSLYGCHSNNGTMQSGLSSAFTTVPSVTTLYFRIVRTSTTSMTVKIYTTSARTTVSEEKTVSVSASTTGLRYVKISPYESTNGGSNTEIGYVKNLKIWNNQAVGAGDDITVSSLDNKRYYMMLFSSNNSTGRTGNNWRFNGDTDPNYAYRRGRDGTEAASGSKTSITWGESVSSGWNTDFSVNYVSNLSSKEKLALGHCVHSQSNQTGTTPNRTEAVGKWANTSDAINSITAHNPEAGSFGSGDEVVVLGWDPSDTHTDNFWEELASVDLSGGESDEISSGTITAKKYLWVQYYREASGVIGGTMQFNDDTGSNYAVRYSNNGLGDSDYGSQSHIELRYKTTNTFGNMFIINNSANEKLVIMHEVYEDGSGATNDPSRTERVGKWVPTSNQQITKIDINNDQAGNFGTKTMMKVWGHD